MRDARMEEFVERGRPADADVLGDDAEDDPAAMLRVQAAVGRSARRLAGPHHERGHGAGHDADPKHVGGAEGHGSLSFPRSAWERGTRRSAS